MKQYCDYTNQFQLKLIFANPYILIDNQKGAKMQAMGYGGINKMGGSAAESGQRLTEQQLNLSIDQDYRFDDLVVGVEEEARREEEKKDGDSKSKAAEQPAKGDEGAPDDSQEEDDGDDGDEEEFNLFYERDEIESTHFMQQYDAFEDVKEIRDDCQMNNIGGNKALNKIIIEDWMPKQDDTQTMLNQKSKKNNKTKSMKSSHTGDLVDDRNQNEIDVDEALELQKKRDQKNDSLIIHKEGQMALKNEIEQMIQQEQLAAAMGISKDETERELINTSSNKKKNPPAKPDSSSKMIEKSPVDDGKNKSSVVTKGALKKDSTVAATAAPTPTVSPTKGKDSTTDLKSTSTDKSNVQRKGTAQLPAPTASTLMKSGATKK